MSYNITNFTNANSIVSMAQASNNLVDGWLFIMIAVLIFVIAFTVVPVATARERLAGASFISFVLNVILWGVGLLSEQVIVVSFVVLLIAIGSFLIE